MSSADVVVISAEPDELFFVLTLVVVATAASDAGVALQFG